MEEEKIFDIESHTQANVPYFVHEAEMARQERTVKRLWILCIVMFLALVISNAGWIVYENQFEDMTIEQEVDTGVGDAMVSGFGDINYGTGETDGTDTSQEK